MKMLSFLPLFLAAITYSSHDHRRHLDTDLLYKEAIRAAVEGLDSSLHAIKFLSDSVADIET
jgi:hypothetical protein